MLTLGQTSCSPHPFVEPRPPMFSKATAIAALLAPAILLSVRPACAAWPNQSSLNLPVSTAAGNQQSPMVVSDGRGGALVTWQDSRPSATGTDIYAQHILASGIVDPAWPADGRAVCAASGSQGSPTLAADGAGGAIITWSDSRNPSADIYAQHV